MGQFTLTTVLQLGLALAAFRFIAPSMFAAEISQPWMILLMIGIFGLPMSLFEYFYHRYLLHSAVLPYLSRMHSAHREHHDLTTVKAPVTPKAPSQMVPVKSEYPVEHEHQEESMMFPVYSVSIFYGIFFLLIGLPAKLMFPQSPAVTALIISVTMYYSWYELWHAVLHLPFERYWKPLLTQGKMAKMWRYVYSFHLMHHWRPTSNESVVGFWGFALWDHVFRTHRRPHNLPLDGTEVNYDDATLKKPLWPVSMVDKWQPAMYRWSRNVERFTKRMFGIAEKASQ